MLLRHAAHKQRRKLKGDALLAWDFYEATEVLNGFLHDLSGEKQPHVDDLGFGSHWKQDYYGIEARNVDYDLANTLPMVLRHYNLDPRPRVLLVLEGESEVIFTRTWCKIMGIDLEREGIRVLSLGGTSDLRAERTERYVAQSVADGASVVMAVDNENQAIRHLRRWRRAKWVARIYPEKALFDATSPVGATLWRPCFEDANFTRDELIGAWHSLLSKNPRWSSLEVALLQAKMEELRPSCVTEIQALLKVSQVLRVGFKKPELAEELARRHAHDNRKPIVLLLQKTVRLATLTSIYNLPGRRAIGL